MIWRERWRRTCLDDVIVQGQSLYSIHLAGIDARKALKMGYLVCLSLGAASLVVGGSASTLP